MNSSKGLSTHRQCKSWGSYEVRPYTTISGLRNFESSLATASYGNEYHPVVCLSRRMVYNFRTRVLLNTSVVASKAAEKDSHKSSTLQYWPLRSSLSHEASIIVWQCTCIRFDSVSLCRLCRELVPVRLFLCTPITRQIEEQAYQNRNRSFSRHSVFVLATRGRLLTLSFFALLRHYTPRITQFPPSACTPSADFSRPTTNCPATAPSLGNPA
jgi:hypothetical protein